MIPYHFTREKCLLADGAGVLSVLNFLRGRGKRNAECFLDCRDFYIHIGPIPFRRINGIRLLQWVTDDPELAARLEHHQAQLEPGA